MTIEISIIIPTYNEEKYIQNAINSILHCDIDPKTIEVIVVDGCSSDNTCLKVKELIPKHNNIFILENKMRHIPHALNIGIKNSSGNIIIRADAHCEYIYNYVSNLVKSLKSEIADVVGGRWIISPRENKKTSSAISLIYSSKIGAGGTTYRSSNSKKLEFVDVIPYGCFYKSTIENVGLYDERLLRSEDMDLWKRFRDKNYKIAIIPKTFIKYYVRSSFSSLFNHSLNNGFWAIWPLSFKPLNMFKIRHFIPGIFVIYLFFIPLTFFLNNLVLKIIILLPLFFYLCICIFESFKLGKRLLDITLINIGFFCLHIGYGIGSVVGLASIIIFKQNNYFSNSFRKIIKKFTCITVPDI